MPTIQPLGRLVLLQPMECENKAGLLWLPRHGVKYSLQGTVVATGRGHENFITKKRPGGVGGKIDPKRRGKWVIPEDFTVKVGDTVILDEQEIQANRAAIDCDVDGQHYWAVDERWILAITTREP